MASVPIKVPAVGESISEGIIAQWMLPDGAAVKKGDKLFELETDKATQVIEADRDGVLRIQAQPGTTVAIGATVGAIDTDATPSESTPSPAPAHSANTPPAPPASSHPPLSPAVRRIAEEEKLDLSRTEGTGPGGRITKGDALAIAGSHAAAAAPRPPAPAPVAAPTPAPAPKPPAGRRETRQRMSGIRQRIAQRLVESQQSTATLTTFNEADLSRVMALRKLYKEPFQKAHGIGLGFMSFFVRAAVQALKAFPTVNGRIEGNDLVLNEYYDIGVAVSTERGLMVPVVRDADQLSFAEIEKAIADYARRARDNAIAVGDLQGGTFTITNGGVFGSLLSTPILNPPQSAILGMHKIQERPVVVDGQIVVRPMMYLALSYDHRVIDGREAVSFLVKIKDGVENPERLLLGV